MDSVTRRTLGLYLLSVNSLVDKGKKETIEDINMALREKRVFDFLESKYGDIQPFDFVDREKVHELLYEMWATFDGRERRKFWVSENGLCVLIAYLNELIVS
ncbi:hypothetical protein [Anoxybacillus sp. ST4]|uniref:hypothetical protein n=1 Tax=Anoxybacillus sp. ST4 TaxID=2864181 RepID=UPI001C640668|nr:hypothetical protein [Anoxybacillus sp. ST4]MBW7652150.1 hypothetical protein [Anoxybacillus sp. ST4]